MAAVSLTLTLLYAHLLFEPHIESFQNWETYDAYRYHFEAAQASRLDLADIFDVKYSTNSRFPQFLAILYKVFRPDPLVGCALNWASWALAGWLLGPLVGGGSGGRSTREAARAVTAFWVCWFLLPDAFDWCGTTSKEPLCALLVALGVRAVARFGSATSPRAAGAWLALLGLTIPPLIWVRGAALALPVAGVLAALELRSRPQATTRAWAVTAVFVGLLVAYASSSFLPDSEANPFAESGSRKLAQVDPRALTSDSALRTISSSNKALDAIALPIRGVAHLVVPLNSPPWNLPIAKVAAPSLVQWTSAAMYCIALCSVVLRVADAFRKRVRLPDATVLLGTAFVAGIIVLGLSGIVHERYRSILMPAYLPIALDAFLRELRIRGGSRLALFAGAVALAALISYIFVKSWATGA